ncbi:BEM_collapsed_G0002000.mRNA.1.CDS.1 [Saccharomyces cerevisiae]|nr:BEM_collapsed_G0002000.mRNA.1.CDS.1 [Saccharomyces cerevisiae]
MTPYSRTRLRLFNRKWVANFLRSSTSPPTSGQKRSRKIAVISVLPNFKKPYINDFLSLASERLDYNYFFGNSHQINSSKATLKTIRRMTGFR